MKKVILLAVLGYFSLWFYIFILMSKFMKSLHRDFPKEAKQILGEEKFLGIPVKPFALWDEEIKNWHSGIKKQMRLGRLQSVFFT